MPVVRVDPTRVISTIPDVLYSTIFCFWESICAKSADTTGIGTQIKKAFCKNAQPASTGCRAQGVWAQPNKHFEFGF